VFIFNKTPWHDYSTTIIKGFVDEDQVMLPEQVLFLAYK